jgi:hypothetical protein
MAVRIPGPQPTAGLEKFFLVESPAWMPGPLDSGARIGAEIAGVFSEWAGGTVAPAAGSLSDLGLLESEIAGGEHEALERANAAVVDAGGANTLRDDRISQNYGVIDEAIDGAGQGIGNAPGVTLHLPPVPEPPEIGPHPPQD